MNTLLCYESQLEMTYDLPELVETACQRPHDDAGSECSEGIKRLYTKDVLHFIIRKKNKKKNE